MLLHVSARWCSKIVPLTFTFNLIVGICLKTVLWYKKIMLLDYLEVVLGLFTRTMELNEICFLVTGKHGSIFDASRSRCRSQHGTWQDGEKSSAFVSYHVYWAWLTSTHEGCFEKGEKYERQFKNIYRKSSIKPPGGAYFFQALLKGGLIERGGLKERGGLN